MAEGRNYRFRDSDGKKTILLIGVLVVLILVIGGALIYVIGQKGSAPPPPPVNNTPPPVNITGQTNQTEPPPPVCDDSCILAGAVSSVNATACQGISDNGTRESCYEQLSNQSLEACRSVSDQSILGYCMTSFAVAGGDITLCDSLAQGRDSCRMAVDPCLEAQDANLCRAMQAGDPSLCSQNTSCLLNYSITKGDTSSCSLIQNSVVAKACVSSILDSDRCYELPLISERDYCYELFAIYSNDSLTCTQISSDNTYMLDCLSTFAVRSGDLAVCDYSKLELDSRWACYTNYSLGTGDITGCQSIHPLATTNRFKCSFEFAKKYGDPSACQVIQSLSTRETCYQGAIIYSNQNLDWRTCGNVTNFEWMNKCYGEAAKKENDIGICDYIADSSSKEACKIAFSVNNTYSG
jgi:hypothetical protein